MHNTYLCTPSGLPRPKHISINGHRRVPSLLVTAQGTLLAFGEGRGLRNRVCADHGDVMVGARAQRRSPRPTRHHPPP